MTESDSSPAQNKCFPLGMIHEELHMDCYGRLQGAIEYWRNAELTEEEIRARLEISEETGMGSIIMLTLPTY
jgi:hypothetical protein